MATCATTKHANAALLQPNKLSLCARTGSTGAGGKHPHTVYSHCNERMLLIMKKEDGSSLRRTHPHITRSVKKGLVVIVAGPACALSLASLASGILKKKKKKTRPIQTPKPCRCTVITAPTLNRGILSACVCARRHLRAL